MKNILVFLFIYSYFTLNAQSLKKNLWGTNGGVFAITGDSNYTYIGGNFDYYGPTTGSGVKLTSNNRFPDLNFPQIDGKIYVVVSDHHGGWYIGGDFSKAGNLSRHNLARINADGSVNPWNPETNGIVQAMAFDDSAIYIGGYFTKVEGVKRHYLAKLDTNGNVDKNWDPEPDKDVYAIADGGDCLFVGGRFGNIGGKNFAFVAKLIKPQGILDENWRPILNGAVHTIFIDGGIVYLGGEFTSLWGVGQAFYALKIYATDASPASPYWFPNPNNYVTKITKYGNKIYLAGNFDEIGRDTIVERKYIACVDDEKGKPDLYWNPTPDNYINDLVVKNGKIYIAGDFKKINGVDVRYIARVGNFTGNVDASWLPYADGPVYSISFNGQNVFLGGNFASVGGYPLLNLFRIKNSDYSIDSAWQPNPNNPVEAIATDGKNIFVGGDFSGIGGQPISYLAKLNNTNGSADPGWLPNPDRPVVTISLVKNTLFIGGDFSKVNNTEIHNLAKIDKSTGKPDAQWLPDPGKGLYGRINKIAVNGNYVYAAGRFYNSNRTYVTHYLRRIPLNSTEADRMWTPQPDGLVWDIAFHNKDIFVCGAFGYIGGGYHNGIAKLNNTSGIADDNWYADVSSGTPGTITVTDHYVYVGGDFQSIGGTKINYLARLNYCSGEADANWDAKLSAGNSIIDVDIASLYVQNNNLFVGGFFNYVGSIRRRDIAIFTGADKPTEGIKCVGLRSGALSHITSVITNKGKIYNWGYGYLGNNDSTGSTSPVSVDTTGILSGIKFVKITSGSAFSVALSEKGEVFSWGINKSGELGDGTHKNKLLPVNISNKGVLATNKIVDISAGVNFVLAITTDGKVCSWGDNYWGELGNGTNKFKNIPGYVNDNGIWKNKKIVEVAAGFSHSLALSSDGKVYAWGSERWGELGNGHNIDTVLTPAIVDTNGVLKGKKIIKIAAGSSHSLALTDDGKVYAWGWNSYGQLGNNSHADNYTPVEVVSSGEMYGKRIIDIAAGDDFSLALASDGSIFAWGNNDHGQLGNNSTTNSPVPVKVYSGGVLKNRKIIAIGAGWDYAFALSCDGKVYAWGGNKYGQLGNNSTADSYVPVEVVWNPPTIVEEHPLPERFELLQNYPNPFNPTTTIKYSIPRGKTRLVVLKVFDILGREVSTLVNKKESAGNYSVRFNASNLPSGVYIYRLSYGNGKIAKKMILLK